jgi:rubrerythrin
MSWYVFCKATGSRCRYLAAKEPMMSNLTEMITKHTFLEICMDIEGLCAELYHFYSKLYKDNPEASRLWKKAALEEENHQHQFGLALRLLCETEFEVLQHSLKRAYSIQSKLQKLIVHVKNNKPDLLTAVSEAVEMEEKLSDLHAYTALNFREDSIQRLFKALSDADCEHVAALQRYQSILFLPHSNMHA